MGIQTVERIVQSQPIVQTMAPQVYETFAPQVYETFAPQPVTYGGYGAPVVGGMPVQTYGAPAFGTTTIGAPVVGGYGAPVVGGYGGATVVPAVGGFSNVGTATIVWEASRLHLL